MANAYIYQDNERDFMDTLYRAAELNEDNGEVYLTIGTYYFSKARGGQREKYKEANHYFEKAATEYKKKKERNATLEFFINLIPEEYKNKKNK